MEPTFPDPQKDESANLAATAVQEQPTEEGLMPAEVEKSEAFVSPLDSDAAKSMSASVVINAEPAVAQENTETNVVELPAPQETVAEAPQETADTDHQIPAQTA